MSNPVLIPRFIKHPGKYFYEGFFFLGSLAGILIALLTAIEKFKQFFQDILGFHISNTGISITIEVLNILILLLFYVITKTQWLEFETEQEIKILADKLNIVDTNKTDKYTTAKFNIQRVNILVGQLVSALKWFMFFLILFYLTQIGEDLHYEPLEKLKFLNISLLLLFENLSNIISAAFIYIGFKVLYDKTLDHKNQKISYFNGTLIFLFIYSFTYILILLFINKDLVDKVNNIYRLICGVYNGLTMGLLFGRFTTMEYFFKNIDLNKDRNSKSFYHLGTVFILPLYVLAQPMFGIFNLQAFGDENLFKAIVFIVCFIGKGFLLLLLYKYINYRWLHVFIHLALANHAIPKDIAHIFPQIASIHDESIDDTKIAINDLKRWLEKEEYEYAKVKIDWFSKKYVDVNTKEGILILQIKALFDLQNYDEIIIKVNELKKMIYQK